MKNGLVISDSGPIFSLAIIDKLGILDELFDEIYIPKAVWEELTRELENCGLCLCHLSKIRDIIP